MSTRDVPWWLVGGTEQCPHCLQTYAVEVEVRCAGCDRGLCAHCVARVRTLHVDFCPDCATAETQTETRG